MTPQIKKEFKRVIQLALDEDDAHRDLTSQFLIPKDKKVKAKLVAKEFGILAGADVFALAFQIENKRAQMEWKAQDGSAIKEGQVIAKIAADALTLLKVERVCLNLLQHLSGIATLTAQFVKEVKGTQAKILDTRKTLPGLRILQKYAVTQGGGYNHRMTLNDALMIKDNHLALSENIASAITVANQRREGKALIVEVTGIGQLREVLKHKVDRILLDNMKPVLLQQAVALSKKKVPLEASGGISLHNVRKVAESGVDYISIGALTHSVKALDISLKF